MPKKKTKFNWATITEQIKSQESTKSNFAKEVDTRFYKPQLKDGNAQVLLRFLPQKDVAKIPFVKIFSHGFKNNGQWYIENCPTTLKGKCPVCTKNSELWNNGDQDTARNRARRLSCYSNVLVIKDPINPENEGKVFIYRYGKKIHEMIMTKIDPGSGSIDDPVMVFDPEEGADFVLRIKTTKTGEKSFPNYDASSFRAPSALTDDQLTIMEEQSFSLEEFDEPAAFKEYEVLEERMSKVLGEAPVKVAPVVEEVVEEESAPGKSDEKEDEDSGDEDSFFENLTKP